MYIDERINGFQFVFEYEGDEIRSVKIDYLSDGTKIATEDISSVKQVEEIREQLTEKIIINLKGLDALKEKKIQKEFLFLKLQTCSGLIYCKNRMICWILKLHS